MQWEVTSLADTAAVAAEILQGSTPGEQATVLALSGDLGAGKTTFTQMLAKQLGVEEVITSPTFVIMKAYELVGQPWQELVHIDAYRVESIDEMRVLGFESLLAQKGTIICIEWAERIASLLPPRTITLSFTQSGDARVITQT